MLFSSTCATGVCLVSRVLAVLKLSQLAAICAEFCIDVSVLVSEQRNEIDVGFIFPV